MLRREAARWVVRLAGGAGSREQEEFRHWHDLHPAHAEAFERASRGYHASGLLRQSEYGRTRSLEPDRAAQPRFAFAAILAAAIAIPVGLLLLRSAGLPPFEASQALMLATGTGEIRRIALEDGSTLTLDTQSLVRVEVHNGRRRATLLKGRTRFAVAPGATPFVVSAGRSWIAAQEALFDVALFEGRSRVATLAGKVTVGSGPAGQDSGSISLGRGEGILIAPRSEALPFRPGPADSAWVRGMLQFDGTPIDEAAAEANRYSAQTLVIGDPEIARLRVTGAFRAGDTAGLARSLAETFDLTVQPLGTGQLLLAKAPPMGPPKKNGR